MEHRGGRKASEQSESTDSQSVSGEGEAGFTRRKAFRSAAVGIAGAAVAGTALSLVGGESAGATTNVMYYGALSDAGADQTNLTGQPDYTLVVKNYAATGFGSAILGWVNQTGNIAPSVYGLQTGGGSGVRGHILEDSNSSPAVEAIVGKGTGPGVRATALTGAGIEATSSTGVGGSFTGAVAALEAHGPIQTTRCGVVSIAYPNSTAVVTVPGNITAASVVLATIQTEIKTTPPVVRAAVPNANGTVKIILSHAPGTKLKPLTISVAWFVLDAIA